MKLQASFSNAGIYSRRRGAVRNVCVRVSPNLSLVDKRQLVGLSLTNSGRPLGLETCPTLPPRDRSLTCNYLTRDESQSESDAVGSMILALVVLMYSA
eukprot:gene185-798_t